MDSTKDKGFFALSAYVAGTRSFYAKKPITKPEDLKGLKIRVQPSPTTIKMIELMGVHPLQFHLAKFILRCSKV